MSSRSNSCPFIAGGKYTRNDIYEIMSVPEPQRRGNWETGYNRYGDDLFIFPTVGSEATGGFDYNNRWEGETFVWYAKNGTSINNPLIRWLSTSAERVFIFTRPAVRNPFTFEGLGRVLKVYDESPVRIDWEIIAPEADFEPPEEVVGAAGLPARLISHQSRLASLEIDPTPFYAPLGCVQRRSIGIAVVCIA